MSQLIGSTQQLQGGVEYWRDEYSGINRLRNDAGEARQHRHGVAAAQADDRRPRHDHARPAQRYAFGVRIGAVAEGRGQRQSRRRRQRSRASYGRGFRAPDIGQLYYRFLNPSSIYQVIGNLNLQPEYANSLQVGGEYATPGRRARFGVNLFRNDVRRPDRVGQPRLRGDAGAGDRDPDARRSRRRRSVPSPAACFSPTRTSTTRSPKASSSTARSR